MMTDEKQAVYLYRRLTKLGYKVEEDGAGWMIKELKGVDKPQHARALRSLSECAVWAGACEQVRLALQQREDEEG